MSTPQQELGKLYPDALVELFEVDLTRIGTSVIIRFCNTSSGRNLELGGDRYIPWPIRIDKYGSSTEGNLPSPKVALSNYRGTVSALLGFHQPRGAIFRRRRILRRHLDDGTDPLPEAQYTPDEFFLDSWVETRSRVTLNLETALAYLNREVPARSLIDLRSGE